jgi:hypothetical protein
VPCGMCEDCAEIAVQFSKNKVASANVESARDKEI